MNRSQSAHVDATTHPSFAATTPAQAAFSVARRINAAPPDKIDEGILAALAMVGSFLGVARVYIVQSDNDWQTIQVVQSWRSEELASRRLTNQVSLKALPWLRALLLEQQLVHLSVNSNQPERAATERAFLEQYAIGGLLGVPLLYASTTPSYLCCDSLDPNRSWSAGDIEVLTLVSESIGRATDWQHITATMRASELRYRMLTTHATDIISLHDPDGTCHYCSPAVQAILGYGPGEVTGTIPIDIIHPDDLPAAMGRGKIHDSGAITTTFRMRHKLGHYIWIETSARAVCDPVSGAISEIVAVTRDIDERKAYEARIEQLAYFDPLTTLANRRRFNDSVQRALLDVGRQQVSLALLYLDLDRFKLVNDTLGHDAGDELLVMVANRLRSQLRSDDLLARLGGDEFAVLLPNLHETDEAARIAQRLIDQIRQPFSLRGHPIHLGVSVGIVCAPHNGTRFEDLLKFADIAMYQAKTEGDRFIFFDPSLSAYNQDQLQLEAELRHAINSDSLTLYYQPILDLRNGAIVSVEALVRWNHPTRGLLLPGEFVPLAEERGLIRALDRWVLRAALHQLATWHESGIHCYVSINLSARTLHDANITEYIRRCLEDIHAPPEHSLIEVTESAVMRDVEMAHQLLGQMRGMGMRVALDDFGSGHAALAYLKRLPVDVVKIDRSFVQGIEQDARDEGVVRAIVALSQSLGIEVVAEGVNTAAQHQWLLDAGCMFGQGFGLGRPMPPEQIEQRFREPLPLLHERLALP
ncbi:MAG: EAL domain-containing protein [Chloroflexaceae bacterium]|jgi:diguanylate cyclase (GGDEF)-like protein/PAS domain S-box-containing protein|nr:EAL domain-containing protein [Chloroflexaceae bacterium]